MSICLIPCFILISFLTPTKVTRGASAQRQVRTVDVVHPRLPSAQARDALLRRSGTVNILALRVEFVLDTLSTTSGDGKFNYADNDTFYFDPPPHDSLYFADQLEFNKFYWRKMSKNALDITWDIYPSGERSAYQLPKKMWQYNYNTPRESDSLALDRGLANLFYDAVTSADEDEVINWGRYDLVIIFHAGAGTEFDLGFTETPHDIPSAWMVIEDFRLHLDLTDGIPVDYRGTQSYVTEGLILPETETHDNVQIAMSGVVVFLFGHWLGAPALYDRDSGSAVVGKWSMMDRGFGNFYGAMPGPMDAWSRSHMGWLTPAELTPGDWSIAGFNFEAPDTVIEAGLIRISSREYFLLECRHRDPSIDSTATALDRDDRRMIFNNDYTVETDSGFRVPVSIDNLDFDTPGSGILIWHVDETLTDLMEDGRFNSIENHRGLDLEEADGAQDIGRNYPFLTPGYGTDYGIFEDAWYLGNKAHQSANQGRAVSFNDKSYPYSRDNSGAVTGVTVNNFSRIDTIMTFSYSRSNSYSINPVDHNLGRVITALGNFDDDEADQEFALFDNNGDTINIYDGDGSLLRQIVTDHYIWGYPAVRDLNGDNIDDIIWLSRGDNQIQFKALVSILDNHNPRTFDTLDGDVPYDGVKFCFGGDDDADGTVLLAIIPGSSSSRVLSYNSALTRTSRLSVDGELEAIHRYGYGSAKSDSFLIVGTDKLFLWHELQIKKSISLEYTDTEDSFNYFSHLVDIDGSGCQDFIYHLPELTGHGKFIIVHDPFVDETSLTEIIDVGDDYNDSLLPVDVDDDGRYEFLCHRLDRIDAFEANGVVVDNFPLFIQADDSFSDPQTKIIGKPLISDLDGDGTFEMIFRTRFKSYIGAEAGPEYDYWYRIDGLTMDGHTLPGFPLVAPRSRYNNFRMYLSQLNDEPGLELLIITDETFQAYNLDFSSNEATVWWGQEYRDNDHSNAIWEPPALFLPRDASILMPDGQCYNWPNPARDETAIRYFLNYPASVDVDIYDILGERVTGFHRTDQAGGSDHEIEWDLTDIARGVYVAIVRAQGNDKSETRVVKIAVVK